MWFSDSTDKVFQKAIPQTFLSWIKRFSGEHFHPQPHPDIPLFQLTGAAALYSPHIPNLVPVLLSVGIRPPEAASVTGPSAGSVCRATLMLLTNQILFVTPIPLPRVSVWDLE